MKSIFSICLLFTTAVSVSAQPVEVNGIVGRSVTFPATVKKGGSLMFSDETIGDVTNRKFTPSGKEKSGGRLQWDSSSGFFSLSELSMQDIGEYKVQNTDQNKNTVFQLKVYVPVSKPQVNIIDNNYRCQLLCTVERGTEMTLTLYREGEEKSYSSSSVRDPNPYLDMIVPVDKGGIYTCEAKNSVSNERSDPLTVGDHCSGGAAGVWQTGGSSGWGLCLLLIAVLQSLLA